MKNRSGGLFLLIILLSAGILWMLRGMSLSNASSNKKWLLRYSRPANQWVEALPVGNGRIGGMIYGKVAEEVIQFNHDALWTGHPMDYQNPGASAVLPEIQHLLLQGKQREAERLAQKRFMSRPLRQCSYQPFGDLLLHFPGHENPEDYERLLDLDEAVARVRYKMNGVGFSREIFASYPDQVIVVRVTADRPGKLTLTASLKSPHGKSEQIQISEDILGLKGRVTQTAPNKVESRLHFEARLKVCAENGEMQITEEGVEVRNADAVTLFLTGASSYVNYRDISGKPAEINRKTLEGLNTIPYKTIRKRHVQDYQDLFHRVDLDLGTTEAIQKETHLRVKDFNETEDPHLIALLFQYGRYLLIASSRPGGQPANLQGLWNDRMRPPWESKYTTNINAEMNYWPAESTNLSECHEPLFKMIEECAQTGAVTAKTFYNSRGWVLHHNTDIWRGTPPINASNHGIWPTGGAWLCQHLWWHYEYTLDSEFLRTRAYPVMKQAALFFIDYLIEDPRNDKAWLISGPSNSPENGGLVMGPTMDHQIIRNLFSNCIEASKILDVDSELRSQWMALKERIAPNQIGQHGQLQEWLEDRDDPENKHRHVSHLWGLHPGEEITEEKTPELFAAARKSLEMRGDGGTGWSMGWKVNFWARLKDGDRAVKLLNNLLTLTGSSETEYRGGGIFPNLFDAHPPFQIDGNFGATSGIAEMLLQSHEGFIELLPALPSSLKDGHVKGLCARGGIVVDMVWDNHQLRNAVLHSRKEIQARIRYEDKEITVQMRPGQRIRFNKNLH